MNSSRAPVARDVARVAGVSPATVSNVLSRPEIVRPETIARVQAAMDELGFVPNNSASALRTGASRLVGVLVPDISDPFYAAIVGAVTDAADLLGYTIALATSHDDPIRELRSIQSVAQLRASGAIVVPLAADWSRLSQLRSVGTNLVIVDRAAGDEYCSVSMDGVRGGELAVAHLLSFEGEGITMINGPHSIPQCLERREGAKLAIRKSGGDPGTLVEIELDSMSTESGIEAGLRIARYGLPRRIFCADDRLARGVIIGLAAEGLKTPQDVQVVGYDDLEFDGGLPRLTTVSQPTEKMGAAAVELFAAEMEEGPAHRHRAITFEPELVIRDTTVAP